MKKLTFLFILYLLSLSTFAQDKIPLHCGTGNVDTTILKTLPWYGNNQFLLDYVDSIENQGMFIKIKFVCSVPQN